MRQPPWQVRARCHLYDATYTRYTLLHPPHHVHVHLFIEFLCVQRSRSSRGLAPAAAARRCVAAAQMLWKWTSPPCVLHNPSRRPHRAPRACMYLPVVCAHEPHARVCCVIALPCSSAHTSPRIHKLHTLLEAQSWAARAQLRCKVTQASASSHTRAHTPNGAENAVLGCVAMRHGIDA